MIGMRRVSLADELLLVALDDVSGRARGQGLDHGLAGSLLLDLVLAERIGLDGRRVVVVDASPVGDVFVDEALSRIGRERSRGAKAWVNALAKGLLPRVRRRLVDEGVLREDTHRFLGLVPYRRFPAVDGRADGDVRARLARAAAGGGLPDARTAALAGLVRATRLERAALPESGYNEARRAVKGIAESDWATEATRKAIADTQAAVMAAVMASVTASVVAGSSGGGG